MMKTNDIKSYTELIKMNTFEKRFEYLKLNGEVGKETFGFNRYLNQKFYNSIEWNKLRNFVIARDHGCDLGILDREIISDRILVHHMNPITEYDIINKTKYLLDPEYLITTIDNTHNAIHYGSSDLLYKDPIIRFKNDTCPWKH